MLWNDPFGPVVSQLTRSAAFMPQADVTVGDSDLVLTMDVPGLTREDLTIDLEDGHLVVRGERKPAKPAEGASWVHSERAFGKFERFITVPAGVDADGIAATMENGVLSVVVPKPERPKPKTIAIASGAQEQESSTEER